MRYNFKLNCKVKTPYPPSERQGKTVCTDDLKEASLALCQLAQIESFKEDYEDLQANRALPHNSSLLPLQPISLGRVIRVGGHLNKASIPFEAKHQMTLSPAHPISKFLLQDLHEKHLHDGREHTLVLVHQQFWIP